MQPLHRLADTLSEAAATLAAARPDDHQAVLVAVDKDSPGMLGEVTEMLQRQRTAALHARTREAAAAASHLEALATDVRTAAAAYADVDDNARSRTADVEQR